jgi:hypothetical protein
MSILTLVVILVVLSLLYWGTNTAPFIIGTFRTMLSWLWIALGVVAFVVFILGILGVSTPGLNIHWK